MLNKHEGDYSRNFRVQCGVMVLLFLKDNLFSLPSLFPWIFLALFFREWESLKSNSAFLPIPFEISQLCEPPGRARTLNMDLLIAWGLCEAVEWTATWELGGWGGLWLGCSFTVWLQGSHLTLPYLANIYYDYDYYHFYYHYQHFLFLKFLFFN